MMLTSYYVGIVLTIPEWCSLPVIVIVSKTGESRKATLISFLLALFAFPFFLPPAVLFEELELTIHLLGCFPS